MDEAEKIAKWRAELPPTVIHLLDEVGARLCRTSDQQRLLTSLVSAAFVAGTGVGIERAQQIFNKHAFPTS